MTPERFACLCCGFLTLTERPPGTYSICPVCSWEDDPLQARDPSSNGGANRVALRVARENYRAFGVSEPGGQATVRDPLPEEFPAR
ncbi:MAG: hydrolase [Planctomycetes bacterium]|nr:hydrolase [Planctomycetota bacterium]